MIVRASGLGPLAGEAPSPRNGMPGFRDYPYGGSRRRLRPAVSDATPLAVGRGRQPKVGERALAALRSLGGEASTGDIRRVMEFDGGPPFNLGYLSQVLNRLAAADPPVVILAGRDEDGKGRPGRWRLGPGAARRQP